MKVEEGYEGMFLGVVMPLAGRTVPSEGDKPSSPRRS
jgi:hypothetical protein